VPNTGRRATNRAGRRQPHGGARPEPRDLLHRYLTPREVFGVARVEDHVAWLLLADQELLLREIAHWLSRFDELDLTGWKQAERTWVAENLVGPHRAIILSLLEGDRTFVSTQSLMIAAKRAISGGRPSAIHDMRPLFMAALSIQGGLGTDRPSDETTEQRRLRLLGELISNAEFHRHPDRGTRVAQSQVRWRDIPRGAGLDLPVMPVEAFERVTGIPLADLQSLGFYLFAQGLNDPGGTPTVGSISGVLHWERERLERVLKLIAAPMNQIAEVIRRDDLTYGEDWTFDAIRRFPVLRLGEDRVLILWPQLVLERTLGWLPFFDMTKPDDPSEEIAAVATRAKTALEKIVEREVIETLAANVTGGRQRGRLFDGPTLRQAFPAGQIADAAIAYGDEWVVLEVSSGQLHRGTVVGGQAATLDRDLGRLIDVKVDQIVSTINHIRADPGRLTGDGRRRRRFVPVLVNAEGVPLNPLTHTTITDRVAAAGRLAEGDVEPLHILDTEDLYVAEAMVETDRLGLNELLRQHRRAGRLRRVDLKDWLALTGRARLARPERLRPSLAVALDLITDNLGIEREALREAEPEEP
jgi:hypothetical protein